MRLINSETLELKEYFEQAVPKYAILSHTWGDEEVSLQQFQHPDAAIEAKAGYMKIKKTCETALKLNVPHVWVDTCCIDKTSSAELSEAINSMFRWYAEAEVCFAYLADVPPNVAGVHPSFRASRWFTRGWTLQELLAPRGLDFYASDWTRIASRDETARDISSITGIDNFYLTDFGEGSRHDLPAKASAAEKMSWAAKRTTTRKEDMAYCLLGIFGVNMPLIYGEGTKAFLRLQEEILQNAFDPSLLAWNTIQNGSKISNILPREDPIHGLMFRMVDKISQHPWSTSPQPLTMRRPLGHLALDPKNFDQSMDIVTCDSDFDWAVTTRGLEITLPMSQNRDPYIVLPCRRKRDPWKLLALPLASHVGDLYLRSNAPTKYVSHHAWHRWPRRRFILMTKQQPEFSAAHNIDSGLWIRSIPDATTLECIYSRKGFVPLGSIIRIELDPFDDFDLLCNPTLAALLFKTKDTKETFAIVIRGFESLPSFVVREWIGPWGTFTPQRFEFCFVKNASVDSLSSLLGPSEQLEPMTTHLEVQGSSISTLVTKKKLSDLNVFTIDITTTPNHVLPFTWRPIHNFEIAMIKGAQNYLKEMTRRKRLSPSTRSGLQLLTFNIALASLLYVIGAITRAWLVRLESSKAASWAFNVGDLPLPTEHAHPLPIRTTLLAFYFFYNCIPHLSYLAPRLSHFLQNHLLILALILSIISADFLHSFSQLTLRITLMCAQLGAFQMIVVWVPPHESFRSPLAPLRSLLMLMLNCLLPIVLIK